MDRAGPVVLLIRIFPDIHYMLEELSLLVLYLEPSLWPWWQPIPPRPRRCPNKKYPGEDVTCRGLLTVDAGCQERPRQAHCTSTVLINS
jgi:hypothetical protein